MTALSVFFLLSAIAVYGWRVDVFTAHDASSHDGAPSLLFSAPMFLGREVQTRIIHSVQLTPVIDVYRVQEGRIWGWREYIMSHNAGLPSVKPDRGRFVYASPWMIVEGGGHSWETIRYRVGTKDLGKNEIAFPPGAPHPLWRDFSGRPLRLGVMSAPLGFQARSFFSNIVPDFTM